MGHNKSDPELVGHLWDLYYTNKDLRLLLDLLAESSGVGASLRVMMLLDKDFSGQALPKKLNVGKFN